MLAPLESMKYQGMALDQTLIWTQHIKNNTEKTYNPDGHAGEHSELPGG